MNEFSSLSLLDTDILSELLKLRNAVVKNYALLYTQKIGPLTISAMTRYEVIRGFKQQNATTQNARFDIFCQNSIVLPLDNTTFDLALDLWALANTNGHPCNDADLLIAATALQHNRQLITGNTRHFEWITGLSLAGGTGS